MSANRFPLPQAYFDPAFQMCLAESIKSRELVENFDRLYKASLSKRPNNDDMAAFTRFVHDSVYMRLPDEGIDSLRDRALRALEQVGEPK